MQTPMLNMIPTLSTIPPLKLSHETPYAKGEGLSGLFFRNAPITEGVVKTDALFMLIFWFSMFFFFLLMGLMVYWCFFKYRRRPGVPIPRSPSHNGPLELFWTIVPSSALLVIFFLGLWTYTDRQIAKAGSIRLDLTAWKWGWGINYPNGAQSQWLIELDPGTTQKVPIFVVPESENIEMRMMSNDVIHSFWIPDFRVKMDVFPNRYTGYTFDTPTLAEGEDYRDHWIFCAEYCGDYHSEMAGVLRVVPWGDYQQWLTEQNTGDMSPIDLGKLVHTKQCAICHTVDGSANTGPTWQNVFGYDVPLADGSTVLGDANYIRESILAPQAKIHQGYPPSMPPFETLSEREILGVIAYIESLSDRGRPVEEIEGATDGEGSGGDETGEGGESAPAEEDTGATDGAQAPEGDADSET